VAPGTDDFDTSVSCGNRHKECRGVASNCFPVPLTSLLKNTSCLLSLLIQQWTLCGEVNSVTNTTVNIWLNDGAY